MLKTQLCLAVGVAALALNISQSALACTPGEPLLLHGAGLYESLPPGGALYLRITGGEAPELRLTAPDGASTYSLSPVPLADNGNLYLNDYTTYIAQYELPEDLEDGVYDLDWDASRYHGDLGAPDVQGGAEAVLLEEAEAGSVTFTQVDHFADSCDEFYGTYLEDVGTPSVEATLTWTLPGLSRGGAFALVTERQSGAFAGSLPLESGSTSLISNHRWPLEDAPEEACFTLKILGTDGEVLSTIDHPCVPIPDRVTPLPGGCGSRRSGLLFPALLVLPVVGRLRRRRS